MELDLVVEPDLEPCWVEDDEPDLVGESDQAWEWGESDRAWETDRDGESDLAEEPGCVGEPDQAAQDWESDQDGVSLLVSLLVYYHEFAEPAMEQEL